MTNGTGRWIAEPTVALAAIIITTILVVGAITIFAPANSTETIPMLVGFTGLMATHLLSFAAQRKEAREAKEAAKESTVVTLQGNAELQEKVQTLTERVGPTRR